MTAPPTEDRDHQPSFSSGVTPRHYRPGERDEVPGDDLSTEPVPVKFPDVWPGDGTPGHPLHPPGHPCPVCDMEVDMDLADEDFEVDDSIEGLEAFARAAEACSDGLAAAFIRQALPLPWPEFNDLAAVYFRQRVAILRERRAAEAKARFYEETEEPGGPMSEVKNPIVLAREGQRHTFGPQEYLIRIDHTLNDVLRWMVDQFGGGADGVADVRGLLDELEHELDDPSA